MFSKPKTKNSYEYLGFHLYKKFPFSNNYFPTNSETAIKGIRCARCQSCQHCNTYNPVLPFEASIFMIVITFGIFSQHNLDQEESYNLKCCTQIKYEKWSVIKNIFLRSFCNWNAHCSSIHKEKIIKKCSKNEVKKN